MTANRRSLEGGIMTFELRNNHRTLRGMSLVAALVSAILAAALCPVSISAQQAAPAAPRPPASHFVQPEPINFDDHDGWTQIFDGKSLENWHGDPDVWHVEDGAIVGVSTPEHPSGTTNIIWRGGEPANFELKLEMKLEGSGANGGVQYRSFHVEPNLGPLPANLTPEQRQQRQQQPAQWRQRSHSRHGRGGDHRRRRRRRQ